MSSVVYGPQLRDVILEMIPRGRRKAVTAQELQAQLPGYHRSAICIALEKLVRWGLARREMRDGAGTDRLGRRRNQFVYWRDL